MRKDNVWKQVLALVLSAALVVGNGTSVSAATGDPAANGAGTAAEGTAGSTRQVTDADAYKELKFDFEDGRTDVSGDDGLYIENDITFVNQCTVPVVTDDDGNPVASEENPSMSEGVEVVDASAIPDATDEDREHGKVLKFDKGVMNVGETGIDYLTSVSGALAGYDYSNGVTFSFDIRPEAQTDWSYLFAFGEFYKNNLTGTIGFIAGYEEPWTPFFPNDGWIEGNNVDSNYAYFADEANAHKWYTMTYIFTEDGMTISVDGVPAVAYKDRVGNMGRILQNLSKGQLRLGRGIVTDRLEGYVGYMDNVSIKPMHPEEHVYEEAPVKVVEATCTEDGYEIRKCSICGLLATIDTPALGHDFGEPVAAKEPTCTEKGNKEYYTCKREANSYFVSEDDGIKQVAKSKVEIDANGHSYGAATVTTKATPDKDGVMTSVCSACPEGTDGHTKTEVINKVNNIALAGTNFAYTGKAIAPAVTVKDSKGAVVAASNYTVSYTNNLNPGTATVTITFKGDKYAGSVRKTFTIAQAASLSLNKSAVTLYTGKASKTATIKATVAGANKTVTWKSSNDKIAKVDKNGKITAVKAGKATITATANGISKSVKVTVKNPTITIKNGKKAVKKNTVPVKRKKSVKLTVSVSPKNSGITVSKLTKKQAKIASVTYKKGKLTIKGKKKGTVKVKITSGKGTKTLTVKVK